jgi:hypothetical protein
MPYMLRDSLKALGLVRVYSIQLRDDKVSKLITWYVGALQKAMDLIWGSIGWRHCFPKLVRKGRGLTVIMGLKIHISMIPKDKVFKKMLRGELMRNKHMLATGLMLLSEQLIP